MEISDLSDAELKLGYDHRDVAPGSWVCAVVRTLLKQLLSRSYNARRRGCLAAARLCKGPRGALRHEAELANLQRLIFMALASLLARGAWRGKEEAVRALGSVLESSPKWVLLEAAAAADSGGSGADDGDGAPAWEGGIVGALLAVQKAREDWDAKRWQEGSGPAPALTEPTDAELLGAGGTPCPRTSLATVMELLLSQADPRPRARPGHGGAGPDATADASPQAPTGDGGGAVQLAAVHGLARLSRGGLCERGDAVELQLGAAARLQEYLEYGLGVGLGAGAAEAFTTRVEPEYLSALLISLGVMIPATASADSGPAGELLRLCHWVFTQASDASAGIAFAFPWTVRVAALKALQRVLEVTSLGPLTAGGSGGDDATDPRARLAACVHNGLVVEARHMKVRQAAAKAVVTFLENGARAGGAAGAFPCRGLLDAAVEAAAADKVREVQQLGRRAQESLGAGSDA
mmetsp:Transcript_26581/g.83135  ORF Transcript_26581/g.83135 Transcript_26581/m.83135 type:complete len:464 (+) Transcript_26581:760-2151(+)